jgi:hypothetical protein
MAMLIVLLSLSLMGANSYQDGNRTGPHILATVLTGAAEAPGPGDPDGRGLAIITLKPDHQVCWLIVVSKIVLPASAAHIHVGVKGVPGPVVVPLSAPNAKGVSSGCAVVDQTLHMNLHEHPEQYYVNVHNSVYPAGAVRGQLFLVRH